MELNKLSRKGLLKIIGEYDEYIKDICDDEQNDINRYPVCVDEYLNNEFLIDKDINDYKLKVINFDDCSDIFTRASSSIMDIFEDLLDVHDITIPDESREGKEGEARLFGETYFATESEVEDELHDFLNNIYKQYTDNNLK